MYFNYLCGNKYEMVYFMMRRKLLKTEGGRATSRIMMEVDGAIREYDEGGTTKSKSSNCIRKFLFSGKRYYWYIS